MGRQRNRRLAGGLGALAAAGAAGWAAVHRSDRQRIEADPRRERLFADFGGRLHTVRSTDDTELRVREFGPADAPTIVLVHGWTCSAEFWKLQVEALRGERRLILPDLRGHGQSTRPPNHDYSTEAFASDLDAVLEACVPDDERALVVGHSLGAMTVIAWAGENPGLVDERVSAAVLVNTGVGDLISDSLVLGVPSGFERLQRLGGELLLSVRAPLPSVSTPISHRVIAEFVVGPDASPAEVAFCEQLVLACPAAVRAAVGGTLGRLDLRHALESLSVPTLLIAGEQDRLTPPKHTHQMAEQLPEVLDLVEIPRSGHMSPVEFETQVNALIGRLSGLPAAVAS
jgi:pimeloyl-ACP methyl ester carboxylesterase